MKLPKKKEFLWKNHAENMQQKIVPDLFIILVNNPKQPLHPRNPFKSKIFWKRIIKKPEKRQLYFLFWTQSLLIDELIKNKRGLALVTSSSSGYKTSSEKFLYYSSDVLFDQVWWCNTKRFLSYSENYICKFMPANPWPHKLFHLHLPF